MATHPSILVSESPRTEGLAGYSPWDGRIRYDLATKQLLCCVLNWSVCSHGIKRCFLLGRKAVTKLDSILKSRDIILPTKVHLVTAMVSPVVMYGCENWTIKKAERQRIDAFYLWCWRRLLRIPWTARRSNHSFLKEISPEYSLKVLMIKLKLQYFSYLMGRTDSWKKDPDAGRDWSQKERRTTENEMVGWHHRLDGHEFQQALGAGNGQGSLAWCSPWGH